MAHPRWNCSVLALGLLIAAGCRTTTTKHVLVTPDPIPSELVVQSGLTEFLRQNPEPSLALRVRLPPTSALGEQNPSNVADEARSYAALERVLLAAGFPLIDRGLMQEVLGSRVDSSGTESYERLRTATKADILLDIVSFDRVRWSTLEYTEPDGTRSRLRKTTFDLIGWRSECRIVLVASGRVVGSLIAQSLPVGHYLVGRKVRRATPDGTYDGSDLTWAQPAEEAAQRLGAELVKLLKPSR